LKWFVVPVALAAVGVFGVGPYLNRVNYPVIDKLKKKPLAPLQTVAPNPDASKFGEPEVEVTITPVKRRPGGSRRRSSHRTGN
jgi:hypothetical protein